MQIELTTGSTVLTLRCSSSAIARSGQQARAGRVPQREPDEQRRGREADGDGQDGELAAQGAVRVAPASQDPDRPGQLDSAYAGCATASQATSDVRTAEVERVRRADAGRAVLDRPQRRRQRAADPPTTTASRTRRQPRDRKRPLGEAQHRGPRAAAARRAGRLPLRGAAVGSSLRGAWPRPRAAGPAPGTIVTGSIVTGPIVTGPDSRP